jgi:polyketide biosynthesis acyl carrier protein
MTKEHVYEMVKKVIMEVLPDLNPEMIDIEKELRNLGANSVDRMEVVTMSMEELGLKIPLMSFAQVGNIEGLVDVLTENYNLIMKNMVHPQC